MIRRRPVVLLAAGALAAGLLAYLFYFWWPAPLLDGGRIQSFSYGPYGANIREFEVHERTTESPFLDEVIALVNGAPLSGDRVQPADGDVLLVLFRDDGLQFHLTGSGGAKVGISEGDGSYRGTLQSPELGRLIGGLDLVGDGGGG
ncbi:MAG: hypothetical protein ACYC6T_14945 [Thermoleophilia bacterium]